MALVPRFGGATTWLAHQKSTTTKKSPRSDRSELLRLAVRDVFGGMCHVRWRDVANFIDDDDLEGGAGFSD